MIHKQKFKEIAQYLSTACFSEDCTVETVCLKFSISRTTLHRIVKANVGLSTTKYINNLRLEEGYNLLLQGDEKIGSVAAKVGYKDAKYFARLFKKRYGLSPFQVLDNQLGKA